MFADPFLLEFEKGLIDYVKVGFKTGYVNQKIMIDNIIEFFPGIRDMLHILEEMEEAL